VAKFKTWAEDVIKSQQQVIDQISGSVDQIEKDIRLFKDFGEEVRTELASNQKFHRKGKEESFSVVRAELDDLRRRISSNQSRPPSRDKELSHRNLEVIARDVQLVTQKVDEINELNRELGQLKACFRFFFGGGGGPATTTLMGGAQITWEVPIKARETRF
jgi:chromosome segregation ATPase